MSLLICNINRSAYRNSPPPPPPPPKKKEEKKNTS